MQIQTKRVIEFGLHLLKWVKRQVWAFIVAYMIGLHNFYHGDQKDPDNIKITVENNEVPGDDAPLTKN